MNIKELAIRGLLQKYGYSHMYNKCPELINELVQLGEELAPRGKTVEVGDHKVTTFPWNPNDIWDRHIGKNLFKPGEPPYRIGTPLDITYSTTDNGVNDYD